jgi:hypothetical protein
MPTLSSLFEQHVLLSSEKQFKMMSRFGDLPWSYSMGTGTLRFQGPRGCEFPAQWLGSASKVNRSWMWAWANEERRIPEPLLQSSLALKAFGAANDIPELQSPLLDLSVFDDVVSGDDCFAWSYFALLAVGILDASCFYAADYDEGILYLLLSGTEIDDQPAFDKDQLWNCLNESFTKFGVSPRRALEAYCSSHGLPIVATSTSLQCSLSNGELLKVSVDARGELILSLSQLFPSWPWPNTQFLPRDS